MLSVLCVCRTRIHIHLIGFRYLLQDGVKQPWWLSWADVNSLGSHLGQAQVALPACYQLWASSNGPWVINKLISWENYHFMYDEVGEGPRIGWLVSPISQGHPFTRGHEMAMWEVAHLVQQEWAYRVRKKHPLMVTVDETGYCTCGRCSVIECNMWETQF